MKERRLVDANEIEKQFDPDTWQGEMMIAIARGLPTAYDLDKVIDKLIERIDPNVDCETGEPCNNWVVNMQNELIGECIDIVRGGVINE